MIPEEEQPRAASEPADTTPLKPRRRSRRGGRRHSKRRTAPPPGGTEPDPASGEAKPMDASPATAESISSEESQPGSLREEPQAAPTHRTPYERRPESPRNPETRREPPSFRRSEPERVPETPGVTQAIEQVTRVIEELKHALDEMEEVLETLELAERQKIDDEREIEALQRALRQLHRPSQSGGQQRH